MTAKYSEDQVRLALAGMDLELYAYKPPDQPGPSQNWKPCDFMVWISADDDPLALSVWVEVKDHQGLRSVATKQWRPTQVAGMRTAAKLGIPYLVVVRWSKLRTWTIGTSKIVLDAVDAKATSIPFHVWPIQCAPGQMQTHLRAALLGEGI